MLTPEQITEIEARAKKDRRILEGTDWISEAVIGASRDRDALLADRDEFARRLAKVREWTIWAPDEYWFRCKLCYISPGLFGRWRTNDSETHVPDCPAAPAGGAATREDA